MREDGSENAESSGDSDGVIPQGDIPLHSTNLLSLLDEDGVIHYQSPSVERLFGFDQSELVGVSCRECFHPDDRKRVYDAFKAVVSSEEFVIEAIEYRHLQADRSYIWVESVASTNPTANGYYVINTRDISERKQYERELERSNEELRRQNRRLDRFASVVSHDFRNPLSVASGRLRRAREECDSEQLEAMVEPLDRMARMIEELRTLTMSQRRELETTAVEIAARAEAAWAMTETGESTLCVDLDRAIECEADLGLLDHIFENLFRNAVVHNERPVTVTVGPLAGGDGFYVADDGVGISTEQIEAVTEYGYSTTKEGTGVGLAIVSEFAEAHGWETAIAESETGGARIEISVEPFRG